MDIFQYSFRWVKLFKRLFLAMDSWLYLGYSSEVRSFLTRDHSWVCGSDSPALLFVWQSLFHNRSLDISSAETSNCTRPDLRHFSFTFIVMAPPTRPEQCAIDIHKNCEKQIFDQMVVNHIPWPKTTKWRDCYNKALKETPCTASILLNYATLQQKFGENLRTTEYCQGLFGIFMNDNHQPLRI